MRTLLFVVLVMVGGSAVAAEINLETYKKKADLTLSAFECTVLAPNDSEGERLFEIGLSAGRDFISFVNANPKHYKALMSQVAMLWQGTSGPTPDFILGRMYAYMSNKVYDELGPDSNTWKVKKEIRYRAKNCSLIVQ